LMLGSPLFYSFRCSSLIFLGEIILSINHLFAYPKVKKEFGFSTLGMKKICEVLSADELNEIKEPKGWTFVLLSVDVFVGNVVFINSGVFQTLNFLFHSSIAAYFSPNISSVKN